MGFRMDDTFQVPAEDAASIMDMIGGLMLGEDEDESPLEPTPIGPSAVVSLEEPSMMPPSSLGSNTFLSDSLQNMLDRAVDGAVDGHDDVPIPIQNASWSNMPMPQKQEPQFLVNDFQKSLQISQQHRNFQINNGFDEDASVFSTDSVSTASSFHTNYADNRRKAQKILNRKKRGPRGDASVFSLDSAFTSSSFNKNNLEQGGKSFQRRRGRQLKSDESVASQESAGHYSVGSASTSTSTPFRNDHLEQWNQRFHELIQFRKDFNHCNVPLNWPRNPSLSHWVKRQRFQYRIKAEGKHSTLTDERQVLLEGLHFVWDSHAAGWEERLNELREFHKANGHCNVPKKYPANPSLAIWVKCQRRQFKLLRAGKTSNMSPQRIEKLLSLGFVFDPRMKRNTSMLLKLGHNNFDI